MRRHENGPDALGSVKTLMLQEGRNVGKCGVGSALTITRDGRR